MSGAGLREEDGRKEEQSGKCGVITKTVLPRPKSSRKTRLKKSAPAKKKERKRKMPGKREGRYNFYYGGKQTPGERT